jgi:nitrogen fixation-related uncharacterized protein
MMAYVLAFIVLASFLDLIGLTVLMWAVGKDLADHDMRIFKTEISEGRFTYEIAELKRKLDEIHLREEARR